MNDDHKIQITTVSSAEQLKQILALQKKNHRNQISSEEAALQGFVTIEHSLDDLLILNKISPQVIATYEEQVVGYALVLTKESENLIEELESMFHILNKISYLGNSLAELNYYVMGQVCIDSSFRGQGLFDRLYEYHRSLLGKRYDFTVTEIATRNLRSLRAHKRIGFEEVALHRDALDEWAVVVRDNR